MNNISINDKISTLVRLLRIYMREKICREEGLKGRCGHIYFLRNNEYVKIGCSTQVKHRLQTLQNEFPGAKILHIHSCNDIFIAEHRWHNYFKNKHFKKEWYKLTDNDIERVRMFGNTSEFRDLLTNTGKVQLEMLEHLLGFIEKSIEEL